MGTPRASRRLIISSQYFIYFGVMGIYLPFFNLYCYHLNFSGAQIGAISATRTVTLVVFPLVWGLLADRFQLRRPIYIFCSFASALIWAGFLFTRSFWVMLAIGAFHGIFYAPIISFLEAFTMEVLGKDRKQYGRTRVWGSISFIVVVLVLGKVISLTSAGIVVALILAGSVLQALVATGIPPARTRAPQSDRVSLGRLLNRRVFVFLVCGFLMLASHGTYYGFFSIHLENLGYSGTFIGVSWALASTAEIVVMLQSDRIFRRFSLVHVLVFSFAAAALRWGIMSLAVAAAPILFAQVLHAFSYGAFHMASILYIDRLAPAAAKTMGQAANNAVSYGLGLMVGFFVNGWLYDTAGASMLFVGSAAVAAAGGFLFMALHDG